VALRRQLERRSSAEGGTDSSALPWTRRAGTRSAWAAATLLDGWDPFPAARPSAFPGPSAVAEVEELRKRFADGSSAAARGSAGPQSVRKVQIQRRERPLSVAVSTAA
jgi:hypothetical protein